MSTMRLDRHDAGVVDEHVNRPELLFGAVEEGAEGGAVGDIQRERDRARAQLGRGLPGEREVDVADRDLHSLTQERLRRRLADPARGAGDRRGLPGEDTGLLGHALLLLSWTFSQSKATARGRAARGRG
jgi:hypothetical protein